ncbi:MAG: hypothetical protein ONB46_06685 [candidate division KSB1 bacterium]|nr:hypothetical protein [candidate division KSB1 bacterium]MDZ7367211.1 hypothetical protein [candidate division KSB1 bacterium]MDZ7405306.1 hypothetical protein [candidate division KSB1 bacterium]
MQRKNKEMPAKKSRYPAGDEKIHQRPNKVSETQVEYGVLTQTLKAKATKILKPYSSRLSKTQERPLSASKKIAGVEMPDSVWQFARKNALFPHLETALRLVHECFPSVKTIKLAYEFDWEVEDESWIAINIQVSGKVDNVLEQYLFFNRLMAQRLPPDKSDKILLGIGGLGTA